MFPSAIRHAARAVALACVVVASIAPAVAGPALRMVDQSWRETVSVQTNGGVEPGETGLLGISLANLGDATASVVTASLAVVAPAVGVSLPGAMTTWPDIEPASTQGNLGGLAMAVDATVPCGTIISLALSVSIGGVPTAVFPVQLRVGFDEPTPLDPAFVTSTETDYQCIAWSGSEYGVAWRYTSNPFSTVRFQRLDPAGSPLGGVVQLPPAHGQDGPPALAWGGDRWAIVRYDADGARLALLDASGALITQTYVASWGTDGSSFVQAIAWDGSGFGILLHPYLLAGPGPGVEKQLMFVHVTRDGVVDAGPTTIDTGFAELGLYARHPILWNGTDFAVLAWGRSGMRLIRLDRSGAVLSMSPPMPLLGNRPDLAWTGHSYGIVSSDDLNLEFRSLLGDGVTTREQVTVVYSTNPLAGPSQTCRSSAVIASDGVGFGIAVPRYGFRSPPAIPNDLSVSFVTVDATGRVRTPRVTTTRSDPSRPFWTTGRSCVWNPDLKEYALPVVTSTEEFSLASGTGHAYLQRVPLSSRCVSGEPPLEVSGPASGSPLLVSKYFEPPCPSCAPYLHILLHVEDLGPAASSYNEYVLATTRAGAAVDGLAVEATYCHLVPGMDARIQPDGPGRLLLRAHRGQAAAMARYEWFLVSASNAWGEGPKGSDRLPLSAQPLNGCLGSP